MREYKARRVEYEYTLRKLVIICSTQNNDRTPTEVNPAGHRAVTFFRSASLFNPVFSMGDLPQKWEERNFASL
jgi:hypothetical protein